MKYLKNWQTYKLNEDAIVNDDDSLNGTGVINNANTNPSASTSGTASASTSGNVSATTQTSDIILSDTSKKLVETIKADSKHQVPYISVDIKNLKLVPYIKLIQEILKIKIDGSFGTDTKNAVLKFQTDKNLTKKDGIVGQETWKSLLTIVGLTDIEYTVTKDKVVSVDSKQKPDNKVKPDVKSTNPSTTEDFSKTLLKDINNVDDVEDKSLISIIEKNSITPIDTFKKLIINNNNKNAILKINKIYFDKTKLSLIAMMNKIVGAGAENYDNNMKDSTFKTVFDTLTTNLVNAHADASILYACMHGAGTSENTITILLNKRSKMSDEYKKNIRDVYAKKYGESLEDAFFGTTGDFDNANEQDINLYKLIDKDYKGYGENANV